MDDLFYGRKENHTLRWLLQSTEFINALVYLVCRREYKNLKVLVSLWSIEIFNEDIKIVILLSVGRVNRGYLVFKDHLDVHFIVFLHLYENKSVIKDLYIRMIILKE